MDRAERDALVEQHLPLVYWLAGRIASRHRDVSAEHDDLVQEGAVALIGAIERYRPQGGASLAGYVTFRIRGAMLDYLRSRQGWSRYRHARVAEFTSLSTLVYDDDHGVGMTLEATIPDERLPDPDERLAEADERAALCAAVARLPERERQIVTWYYTGRMQDSIGAHLGISQSRVSQIRSRAIRRLRAAMTEEHAG